MTLAGFSLGRAIEVVSTWPTALLAASRPQQEVAERASAWRLMRRHGERRGFDPGSAIVRRLRVLNTTRDRVLATSVQEAANPWTRMVGLLGRATLAPGEGVYLRPCGALHTWFMRFAIDVLYLDTELRVVKAVPALRPFRLSSGGRRAGSTLELPTGTIAMTATQVGDQLRIDDGRDDGNGT